MSALWIALVVLTVPPDGAGSAASASESVKPAEASRASDSAEQKQDRMVPFRTGRELRDAARETLARWAKPDDKDAAAAACEFLVLYRELQVDRELVASQRDLLRSKVRGRLMALGAQIAKHAAIQRRLAKDQERKAPESVAAAQDRSALGQMGLSGSTLVPNVTPGAPGGGAMGNNDYGEDLVELIQETIVPSSWDVNGGPGSIYYWRPGHALVISATGEVHDQIADVLDQLERVGR